jgi:hypothetical protein
VVVLEKSVYNVTMSNPEVTYGFFLEPWCRASTRSRRPSDELGSAMESNIMLTDRNQQQDPEDLDVFIRSCPLNKVIPLPAKFGHALMLREPCFGNVPDVKP